MVNLSKIQEAHRVLEGAIRRTPLLLCESISRMVGQQVYLKAENLQRTGSFKVRGAFNKIASLTPEERGRGVVAASAGNHAQGVAVAAVWAGIPATIVMPETASLAKVEATRNYGAKIIRHGVSFDQAVALAERLTDEEGLTMVHPFDDEAVIAGQGTVGLEVLQDAPEVDLLVVPVGGGGLISGIAVATKGLRSSVKVVGVQSAAASAAVKSYQAGRRLSLHPSSTIADGIAVGKPGHLTLPLMKKYVDDMVAVDEEEISQAMVLLLERGKLLVEGAGAVGLAALLSGKAPKGEKAAVILSGGNVDVNLLARVVEHGLTTAGRYLILRVKVADRPGQLAHLLSHFATLKVNVVDVDHHRTGVPLPVGQVEVQLTLETKDANHAQEVCDHLKGVGYREERVAQPEDWGPKMPGRGISPVLVHYFVADKV